MPNPDFVNPDDDIRDSKPHNDLVEEVRWLRNVRAGGGISISKTMGGWIISAATRKDYFLGQIVATGPAAEDDFTDNRYWVTTASCSTTDTDLDAFFETTTFEEEDGYFRTICVTNLGEPGGTHLLHVDDTIIVYRDFDLSAKERYYCVQPVNAAVAIQITGAAAGGGKYDGKIYGWTEAGDPTTQLDLPEGMTEGDDCLIYHTPENGQDTHWLEDNSYAAGVVVGKSDEDTPRWIVVIDNGRARTASPVSLDDGSGLTEGVKTWNRDTVTSGDDEGDTPFTQTFVTRLEVDAINRKVVYFQKTRTVDAAGHEVSVSAETKVDLDTGEDCTE